MGLEARDTGLEIEIHILEVDLHILEVERHIPAVGLLGVDHTLRHSLAVGVLVVVGVRWRKEVISHQCSHAVHMWT